MATKSMPFSSMAKDDECCPLKQNRIDLPSSGAVKRRVECVVFWFLLLTFSAFYSTFTFLQQLKTEPAQDGSRGVGREVCPTVQNKSPRVHMTGFRWI